MFVRRRLVDDGIVRIGRGALLTAALGILGCGVEQTETLADSDAESLAQSLHRVPPTGSCGYRVEAKHHSDFRQGGFTGWLELTNVFGARAREFELAADLGGARARHCRGAECEPTTNGYLFSATSGLGRRGLEQGETHRVAFQSRDRYSGIAPYVVSINGVKCDRLAPEVSLSANQTFFTATGKLKLSAAASDNVAVQRVVFQRDGVTIGVDSRAPYVLELAADARQNGRHIYTAVAYDPSGNQAVSNRVSVLTGIGNKFFGTAPDTEADYTHLLTYFDQITPANAAKWGSVEANRDEMNWSELDSAYQFARANGLPFKFHTLVWGQQQPSWLSTLPVEEQLAEIEEWMSLAAQRYPDVELVDVVNEPLHAPPAYTAALGGAGETGWDWVVQAFVLARKYFPKAELILNDYNVEALESFATDYLAVIDVLNARGLIDGIGLQAHFLERADIPVIAANLDRFANTGLPIYVSELDVNFANDARQAQRMRELFSLFWEHPAVLGITHWGHLQGNTWRSDAYLVRSDGTPRPALQWIQCYRAGGRDCTVPEYVPEPRVGDDAGITLQAEDYDDASGVLALGNAVAYTDEGDWLSFQRVGVEAGWNTLSVTYSKGNEEPGGISLHLGSLESPALANIELSPTGGWGVNQTISVPVELNASGEVEVFVRFNGTTGIGNLDRVRLGLPQVPSANLVTNGTFESNADDWFSWDGTVSITPARAHGGSASLLISDRISNAPAATNLTSVVAPGATYQVSAWVSIGGAATADVNLTRKVVCDGAASYAWVANPITVADGQWVQLQGALDVPNCNLSEVLLYAEGPAAGVDLYVDDVTVNR